MGRCKVRLLGDEIFFASSNEVKESMMVLNHHTLFWTSFKFDECYTKMGNFVSKNTYLLERSFFGTLG